VRTLEPLFGEALARGCSHIYATGAYGSNHSAAAAMHAPRVGLVAGAVLYPQPHCVSALENLELTVSHTGKEALRDLPHWSALPYGMVRQALACRRHKQVASIMEPGGAVPIGALGYVSAGLELAMQVTAETLPAPRTVVVAVGSNCTSAGLLVGFALAARAGVTRWGGDGAPPRLVSVRVTPWPVTSVTRILGLAVRTSELLARASGDETLRLSRAALRPHFRLETRYLGPGYGYPTAAGREAMALWSAHAGHALETTYSGKAAAHVIDLLRRREPGPIVYWATKSTAPLPPIDAARLASAPARMRRWMDRARQA
jgi:D-cysteine desulfhydrase